MPLNLEDRRDELFTTDGVYDASDFGQEVMRGIDAARTNADWRISNRLGRARRRSLNGPGTAEQAPD
jgi:hypothetical protein